MSKKAKDFVLVILLTGMATAQFAGLVTANPVTFPPYPIEPNKEPPILTIQSPTNITYYGDNILLNFTVTLPDSWGGQNHVKEISYQIDGETVALWSSSTNRDPDVLPKTHQFSTVLTKMAEAQHNLKIKIDAVSFYGSSPPSSYDMTISQTVLFTLAVEPSASPFVSSLNPSLTADLSPSLEVPEFTPAAVLILASALCFFAVAFRKRH
jgi:hypothetical protein